MNNLQKVHRPRNGSVNAFAYWSMAAAGRSNQHLTSAKSFKEARDAYDAKHSALCATWWTSACPSFATTRDPGLQTLDGGVHLQHCGHVLDAHHACESMMLTTQKGQCSRLRSMQADRLHASYWLPHTHLFVSSALPTSWPQSANSQAYNQAVTC